MTDAERALLTWCNSESDSLVAEKVKASRIDKSDAYLAGFAAAVALTEQRCKVEIEELTAMFTKRMAEMAKQRDDTEQRCRAAAVEICEVNYAYASEVAESINNDAIWHAAMAKVEGK